MHIELLPITCPLCGRKHAYRLQSLIEGAMLECPSCRVRIRLHGHMWEEIERDIARLKGDS